MKITAQQAFNIVYTKFVHERKGPGIDPGTTSCQFYIHKTGNRCALGWLLPEEVAKGPNQERFDWLERNLNSAANKESYWPSRLRNAHNDTAWKFGKGTGSWTPAIKKSLEKFARKLHLKIPTADVSKSL